MAATASSEWIQKQLLQANIILQLWRFIMGNTNQSVEIVLHVDDVLGEEQRNDLALSLRSNDGVYDARFTPNRDHLMLVKYNRVKYKAIDILHKLTSNSVRAELIGPV